MHSVLSSNDLKPLINNVIWALPRRGDFCLKNKERAMKYAKFD